MTSDEKKWQAERDARALKEAEEVRQDDKRLKAAMKVIEQEKKAIDAVSAHRQTIGVLD
jgi:hypothetical protein